VFPFRSSAKLLVMPFSYTIARVAMTAFCGGALAQGDGGVRINQIQIIGTHNSYHSGFAPSATKLWQQKNPKIFAHVQDVDYRSACEPFTACLAEVRAWSKAHPNHLPVFILVETKQSALHVAFPTVTPEPFTPAIFDALDREITSVFRAGEMITPDDVRGSYATLNQAVRADNWPTLQQARGKVVFLMDQKNMGPVYLEGHPSLKGRILFTNADAGTADAAFIEQNDAPAEAINALVRQGYLIRARADSDTKEARTNHTARRDEVLASGAQIISTDYPASEQAASGYKVELPGNAVARCNPVLRPKTCVDGELASDR
jgi:calcium-dependent phosphoinositide phospholipase C